MVALSAEPRATGPLQEVVDVLTEVTRAPLPTEEAADQPLTIALAGRTKAGKSQLVAALTGDVEGHRIGVGRQRTTRKATSHQLAGFTVLDTPGVAALDGDKDTLRALAAMEKADAVLWLYAESLQEEEADELEDLLRRGKPVVVAYNAKWSVDLEERRRIFASHPKIAFRDLAGHEERIQQIADRAGTNRPPFIPVHARAAWWAVKLEGGSGSGPRLREASRIDSLQAACRDLLFSRAEALRVQQRHDARRVRINEYAAVSRVISNMLTASPDALLAEFKAEREKLLRSIEAVSRNAERRLLADVASARKEIPAWLEHAGDSAPERWNEFLEEHHVLSALDEFTAEVAREVERQGALFAATTALRERFALRRKPEAAPGAGWFGKLKSGARIVARSGLRMLKDLGISRGVSKLLAKLGSRALPGGGQVLLLTDAAAAVSAETREEIKRRRALLESWERDTRALYEADLDEVEAIVRRRLSQSRRTLVADVRRHYGQAQMLLEKRADISRRAELVSEHGEWAITACDVDLVRELLGTQGLEADVARVARTPGRDISVEIEDPALVDVTTRTLRPLFLSETVTVTARRTKSRKKEA